MLGLPFLILSLCAALSIVAAYALLKGYREIASFDGALKILPNDVPAASPFNGSTNLGRAANEYIAMFSIAGARNLLGSFRVEQASSPLLAYLRSMSNGPRNLVGVLILGGLLVTLFNLQGSVAILGASFNHLAKSQSSTAASAQEEVKQIQESMGGIARTAQTAFISSGLVIFAATLILLVSLALQRRTGISARRFVSWANAAHLEAMSARPMDEHAQIEKFGELIGKMGEVISSFEAIGSSMATVGDFGSKLDESSQLVAQAVSQLPATINSSVAQLSAEVTKDISVHLEHQIEHIKKI